MVFGVPHVHGDPPRETQRVRHRRLVGRQQQMRRSRHRTDRTRPIGTGLAQDEQIAIERRDGQVRDGVVDRLRDQEVERRPTAGFRPTSIGSTTVRTSRVRADPALLLAPIRAPIGSTPNVTCSERYRSSHPRRTTMTCLIVMVEPAGGAVGTINYSIIRRPTATPRHARRSRLHASAAESAW